MMYRIICQSGLTTNTKIGTKFDIHCEFDRDLNFLE